VAAGSRADVLILSRHGAVNRVLLRVLALNLLVAVAKLVLGYATGAVSVISDGFHSLTDSASNVMGLVSMRVSGKPPDVDHPYGHRKYETLAAAGIFVFLLLVVVEVARAAVRRLAGGGAPQVTGLSFGIMIATLIINVGVVVYEGREGRRLSSELLHADAMHTKSDVFTSCAVLVSLLAVRLGYPMLDPIGGLVIAIFIAHTGWQIALQTSRVLSDQVVIAEDAIRHIVMDTQGVVGCHQIRTRGSEDHTFLDLHVWYPPDMPLHEAHRLSHIVKDRLMDAFPQIADAIIHIEPPPPNP
jgi:cation diffusion facilitator family transporter